MRVIFKELKIIPLLCKNKIKWDTISKKYFTRFREKAPCPDARLYFVDFQVVTCGAAAKKTVLTQFVPFAIPILEILMDTMGEPTPTRNIWQ